MTAGACAVALAALLLAACQQQSPLEKAKARLEFLKKEHAENREVCEAARAAKRAAADAQNSEDYLHLGTDELVACSETGLYHDIQRWGMPDVLPDNMAATADNLAAAEPPVAPNPAIVQDRADADRIADEVRAQHRAPPPVVEETEPGDEGGPRSGEIGRENWQGE